MLNKRTLFQVHRTGLCRQCSSVDGIIGTRLPEVIVSHYYWSFINAHYRKPGLTFWRIYGEMLRKCANCGCLTVPQSVRM
jgi:hypothetical protein